jgi:hypothetical protein
MQFRVAAIQHGDTVDDQQDARSASECELGDQRLQEGPIEQPAPDHGYRRVTLPASCSKRLP